MELVSGFQPAAVLPVSCDRISWKPYPATYAPDGRKRLTGQLRSD